MCHDFVVIPTIRRTGHSRLLCHNFPDRLLDAERDMLSFDQSHSVSLFRYFYAEALSLQYSHGLRHHLQRAIQRVRAPLHVKTAGLTRKENSVIIPSAVTSELAGSA